MQTVGTGRAPPQNLIEMLARRAFNFHLRYFFFFFFFYTLQRLCSAPYLPEPLTDRWSRCWMPGGGHVGFSGASVSLRYHQGPWEVQRIGKHFFVYVFVDNCDNFSSLRRIFALCAPDQHHLSVSPEHKPNTELWGLQCTCKSHPGAAWSRLWVPIKGFKFKSNWSKLEPIRRNHQLQVLHSRRLSAVLGFCFLFFFSFCFVNALSDWLQLLRLDGQEVKEQVPGTHTRKNLTILISSLSQNMHTHAQTAAQEQPNRQTKKKIRKKICPVPCKSFFFFFL